MWWSLRARGYLVRTSNHAHVAGRVRTWTDRKWNGRTWTWTWTRSIDFSATGWLAVNSLSFIFHCSRVARTRHQRALQLICRYKGYPYSEHTPTILHYCILRAGRSANKVENNRIVDIAVLVWHSIQCTSILFRTCMLLFSKSKRFNEKPN